MLCCICGRRIKEGELFLHITFNKLVTSKITGKELYAKLRMEDGSREKFTCPTCPVMAGGPLALIGADRGYDV